MTGDEDDGNPDACVGQLVLKVQTADSREPHVQNQTTWAVRPRTAQELLWCSEGLGTQTHRFKHALDGRSDRVIVVNHEHCGSGCRRHSFASLLVGRLT